MQQSQVTLTSEPDSFSHVEICGASRPSALLEALSPLLDKSKTYDFRHWIGVLESLSLKDQIDGLLPVPGLEPPQNYFGEIDLAVAENLLATSEPTIAFSASTPLCGSPLMAVAVQELRSRGHRAPNIVFINELDVEATATVHLPDGRSQLIARRGHLIDRDGKIYFGDFGRAVVIDLTYDQDTLWAGRESGRDFKLVNSAYTTSTAADKSLGKRFMKLNGFPTPASIHLSSETASPEELPTIVKERLLVRPAAGLVVKPLDACQGKGVIMLENAGEEALSRSILQTLGEFGACQVEEWARSYPLFDADGQRYDWNMRVLVSRFGFIDLEARVAPWGKPINKALGAKIEEVENVFRRLGTGGPLPAWEDFLASLKELSMKVAESLEAGYLGLDLILDESGSLQIVELNCGNIGGLVSLKEIRTTRDAQLGAPAAFVKRLAQMLEFREVEPLKEFEITEREWPPSDPKTIAGILQQALADFTPDSSEKDALPAVEQFLRVNFSSLDEWEFESVVSALCSAYQKLNEHANALRVMEEYHGRYEGFERYEGFMGFCALEMGAYEKALKLYTAAAEKFPGVLELLEGKAISALHCRQAVIAADTRDRYLEKAVSTGADSRRFEYNFLITDAILGNSMDRLVADLGKRLFSDPENQVLKYALARCLMPTEPFTALVIMQELNAAGEVGKLDNSIFREELRGHLRSLQAEMERIKQIESAQI